MALKLENKKITQLFRAIIFISLFIFIPRPIETANASILKANANIKTSKHINNPFLNIKPKL